MCVCGQKKLFVSVAKNISAADPHKMTQTKWVGRFAGKERSKYKSKVTKVEKLRIGEFRDLGIRGFRN